MKQFEQAIVRIPCDRFPEGITPGSLGKADVASARKQHQAYIETLKACGVKVTVLEAENDFPDSCFVEDPAIVTDRVAIITRFGAASRSGETPLILPAITAVYGDHIETIQAPGTVEGGDICQVGEHFFIGLSLRTNDEGARQLGEILKKYGFTSSTIDIRKYKTVLHLKTGMSYLGNDTFIVMPEIMDEPELKKYTKLVVTPEESYAANCIRVNDFVIIPAGFTNAIAQVEGAGFKTLPLEMSEFRKQDGGLSCLSLRIPELHFASQ